MLDDFESTKEERTMKHLKIFLSAILAGICIGIGGTAFLLVDSTIVGAFLFAIGLFVICTSGLHLYTGKVCYCLDNPVSYLIDLSVIWTGNLVGTWCVAKLMLLTRSGFGLAQKAASICETKLSDSVGSVFILAFFCNILIYFAVDGYQNIEHEIGKYLAVFLGVVVFVLCGFEHCIANMYYFSVAGVWEPHTWFYLIVITIGNGVGGLFFPALKKCIAAGGKRL